MITAQHEINIHFDYTEDGWVNASHEGLMNIVDSFIGNEEIVWFDGNSCMNPYVTVTIPLDIEKAQRIEEFIINTIENDPLLKIV